MKVIVLSGVLAVLSQVALAMNDIEASSRIAAYAQLGLELGGCLEHLQALEIADKSSAEIHKAFARDNQCTTPVERYQKVVASYRSIPSYQRDDLTNDFGVMIIMAAGDPVKKLGEIRAYLAAVKSGKRPATVARRQAEAAEKAKAREREIIGKAVELDLGAMATQCLGRFRAAELTEEYREAARPGNRREQKGILLNVWNGDRACVEYRDKKNDAAGTTPIWMPESRVREALGRPEDVERRYEQEKPHERFEELRLYVERLYQLDG